MGLIDPLANWKRTPKMFLKKSIDMIRLLVCLPLYSRHWWKVQRKSIATPDKYHGRSIIEIFCNHVIRNWSSCLGECCWNFWWRSKWFQCTGPDGESPNYALARPIVSNLHINNEPYWRKAGMPQTADRKLANVEPLVVFKSLWCPDNFNMGNCASTLRMKYESVPYNQTSNNSTKRYVWTFSHSNIWSKYSRTGFFFTNKLQLMTSCNRLVDFIQIL